MWSNSFQNSNQKEYEGRDIDIYEWELSQKDKDMLDACIRIIDYNESLRKAARNTCVSKSSLHRYIHGRLKTVSWGMYNRCINRLKRHISRKRWWY